MKTTLWLALALALAGCAGVRDMRYSLIPQPNSCQATEVRASAFSTLITAVCWDLDGRALGMVGSGGMPTAQVPLTIVGGVAAVAGPVVGAGILGKNLVDAASTLQRIKVDGTVSGGVTTHGTVTVEPPR